MVHETSGGSYTSPDGDHGSGPLTGRLYACEQHAAEIHREDAERPYVPHGRPVSDVLCTAALIVALFLHAAPEVIR